MMQHFCQQGPRPYDLQTASYLQIAFRAVNPQNHWFCNKQVKLLDHTGNIKKKHFSKRSKAF